MADDSPISPSGSKPKSQTYSGKCHCGQIRFTVKLSPPLEDTPVTNCNCSICDVHSLLMVYPLESNIIWHSGKDTMTGYTFGKRRIEHTFCPTCGTSMGGKSTDPNFFADNRAINVRTLEGVDISKLEMRKVDGKSL